MLAWIILTLDHAAEALYVREHKETGLVVGWSCCRAWDMRCGNAEADSLIAQAEAKLGEGLQGARP
jgi:hypothetical protein